MSQEYAKELHKRIIRKFPRREIYTSFVDDIWAIDLLDVSNMKTFNKNITFLLCVLDIYSRYVFVIPLKNKNKETVLNAFKTLGGKFCDNLWADEGKEWYNSSFKKFCKEGNINLYHTYSGLKSVFIERFNKTLRDKIEFYLTKENTKKYIDELPKIVEEYNNTIHSKTGETPFNVYKNNAIPKPNIFYNGDSIKYKIGDYVRISKVKNLFEKGSKANWSPEVFEIVSIDDSQSPIFYKLKDLKGENIDGNFYEEELQLTKVPHHKVFDKVVSTKTENKKKMYEVSYKGLPNKFNDFVTEKELKALKS